VKQWQAWLERLADNPGELISWQVVSWVLPVVLLSIAIGFYLGRCWTLIREDRRLRRDREKMVKALVSLVKSTEQLTHDVDSHNSELQTVGKNVEDLHADDGEFEELQQQLLSQICSALESNKRLEDDLVCARYQMEQQAVELDRTRKEARTDALAGVPNRKGFDERLQFAVSSFKRKRTTFALLMCDVDHFKWINDTHGHQAGDRVVQLIGETLSRTLRPTDFVGRYGGDEFAVILAGVNTSAAIQTAERIRHAIEQRNFDVANDGSRVAVTFSMGMAIAEDDDTIESIMTKADKALYKSKQGGRNQLNVYCHEDDADIEVARDAVEAEVG
jgi:diguanylate cyclase